MRPGQNNNPNNNKNRSRGRNNNGGRKHLNPLSRNYESNGPDVKVRGNAAHIAEKYVQLARDAHASGDSVMAENYLQHAEHYFRIVSAAQPQMPRNDQFTAEYDGDENEEDFGSDEQSRFDSPQFRNNGQQPGERGNGEDRQGRNESRGDQNGGDRQPRFQQPERGEQPSVEAGASEENAGGAEEQGAAPAEAAEGESEPPRRVRERRPRRRRPPMGENGAVDPNGPQPDVGELPAFITAGGATNPAE
jgi:hypothetical protein